GLRDYPKIYGVMFAMFSFGVGIGPALSGASFDLFRSYTPIFAVYEIMLAITCVVFLRLGPYPYPAEGAALSGGRQQPARGGGAQPRSIIESDVENGPAGGRRAADAIDLTRTGPGTPGGRFFRQFWVAIHRSQDLLPGQAKPIRILGEDFAL